MQTLHFRTLGLFAALMLVSCAGKDQSADDVTGTTLAEAASSSTTTSATATTVAEVPTTVTVPDEILRYITNGVSQDLMGRDLTRPEFEDVARYLQSLQQDWSGFTADDLETYIGAYVSEEHAEEIRSANWAEVMQEMGDQFTCP